jgi:hypothetical protein
MGERLLLTDLRFVKDVQVVCPFALLNRLDLSFVLLAVFEVTDVQTLVFFVVCGTICNFALLVPLHLGHYVLDVLIV